MGWWGYNVMEGDTPMDMEIDIEEALECYSNSETMGEKLQTLLKAGKYHKLIDQIRSDPKLDDEEMNIKLQVLGEMVMVYGGSMSERAKGVFRRAARDDSWAKEYPERREAMTAFIKRITEYVSGVAIEPCSEGLMSAIAQHLEWDASRRGEYANPSMSKNGLVNKK